MKTPQIIGSILTAVGLGAVIYFGFVRKFADGLTGFQKLTKKKPTTEEPPKKDDTGAGTGYGTPKPKVESGFPLSKGSRGTLVTRLANALKLQWGKDTGTPTHIFGKDTLKALQEIGYGDSVPNEQTLRDIEMKKTKALISPTKPKESGIKNGATVYAATDTAVYTKPIVDYTKYGKTNFNKFDKIGVYMGDSSEKGWGKVYIALYEADFFIPYKALTTTKI